jgi:DNA-binding MarR family transcriptional regulator
LNKVADSASFPASENSAADQRIFAGARIAGYRIATANLLDQDQSPVDPLARYLASRFVEGMRRGRPIWQLPHLDAAEDECWQRFMESSSRVVESIHRALVLEHKLSLHDVMLLCILAKAEDGSARMGDLAEALVLIPSRVTEQVARLEAQGLLHRRASTDDRRGVIATITQVGRVRLKPAMQTYARAVRSSYLNSLSRQQMSSVSDSCRRISWGLKASAVQPDSRARSGADHNSRI